MKYTTACAIIENNRGEILLSKRGREPFKNYWALISGIGASINGMESKVGVTQEVKADLGTGSFKGKFFLSLPLADDPVSDKVDVYVGKINESEIKINPVYSAGIKWVSIKDTDQFQNLAFEHSKIIRRYIEFFGEGKIMIYLYLDESGDLGFDFVNKKPSKFFTVGVLVVNNIEENKKILQAVKITLRRKLNPRSKRKRVVEELKGERTNLTIKKYFYQKIQPVKFSLYAITLNKIRVYERLARNKSRVYNFMARQVLDQISFQKSNNNRIIFIIDKSKGKLGVEEFNEYVLRQLEGRIHPKVPFDIYHENSKENKGLQAIDMFAWGIHRKYEYQDKEWYEIFKMKIKFDKQYL